MGQYAVWGMRALEVLFFSGIIGCSVVVLLSWISVLKGSFKDEQ